MRLSLLVLLALPAIAVAVSTAVKVDTLDQQHDQKNLRGTSPPAAEGPEIQAAADAAGANDSGSGSDVHKESDHKKEQGDNKDEHEASGDGSSSTKKIHQDLNVKAIGTAKSSTDNIAREGLGENLPYPGSECE